MDSRSSVVSWPATYSMLPYPNGYDGQQYNSHPNGIAYPPHTSHVPSYYDPHLSYDPHASYDPRASYAASYDISQPSSPTTPQNTLSLAEFYARFIDRRVPPVSTLHGSCLDYLTSARLSPKDAQIWDCETGMVVALSERGQRILEDFGEMKRRRSAVIVLQKVWRGYCARKRVNEMKKGMGTGRSASPVDNKMDERRVSRRVTNLRRHLQRVSVAYREILLRDGLQAGTSTPSPKEIEFMKLLNSEQTFRLSAHLSILAAGGSVGADEEAKRREDARMSVLGGPLGQKTPAQIYQEYGPRVVEWLRGTLSLPADAPGDIMTLLQTGDVLCHLACKLYPRTQCQLLTKGPEFTVHKIIFFLELCKTVGVKPKYLFSVADILMGVDGDPSRRAGLTVLRTVCALERQARRQGWDGPVIILKEEDEDGRRRSKRASRSRARSRSNSNSMMARDEQRMSRRPSGESLYSMYAYRWSRPAAPTDTLVQVQETEQPTHEAEPSDHAGLSEDVLALKYQKHLSVMSADPRPSTPTSPPASDSSSHINHTRTPSHSSDTTVIVTRDETHLEKSDAGSTYDDHSFRAVSNNNLTPPASPPPSEATDVTTDEHFEEVSKKALMKMQLIKRKKREGGIKQLVLSEEHYVHNLTVINSYGATLLQERKAYIRHVRKTLSDGTVSDSMDSDATSANTPPPTIDPASSLARLAGEDDKTYLTRLQNETNDYIALYTVMQSLLSLHEDLLSALRRATIPPPTADPELESLKIGHPFLHFSSALTRPYITYAVLTTADAPHRLGILSSKSTARDRTLFVEHMQANFKGKDRHPVLTISTEREWRHHLLRPLLRLKQYSKLLADVGRGIHVVGVEEEDVRRDERLCLMAGLKIEALVQSVESGLGIDI
ncbi:uncharacterized protein SPPG_06792 [Spizellomyces punctatus DAOM BR117]|uniref:DH domain-containing protein n=1 Tax=Spizellomyces punctatus (strain DAOM BR117) TaxID=645134 RepID=A0A0L0H9C7_SPIPD|nr:uncharacterized protein SPPG_06792 [Spizellomyces punctatus DAOM BR117]KNC97797.1 hypothetical protein SPPG_06792 [Spizellomyces punctatus DAOM BR117]|eukprot:XP_016605837.1 hypothetical protein SPPG_06792 [Spizellomyces punctatus DAOM BR117]